MNHTDYETCADGSIKKITKVNKTDSFEFLGNPYTLKILREAKQIKTYQYKPSLRVLLLEDMFQSKFLYTYRKVANLENNTNLVEETFCHVTDEADSDEIYQNGNSIQEMMPYIYVSENNLIKIYEIEEIEDLIICDLEADTYAPPPALDYFDEGSDLDLDIDYVAEEIYSSEFDIVEYLDIEEDSKSIIKKSDKKPKSKNNDFDNDADISEWV